MCKEMLCLDEWDLASDLTDLVKSTARIAWEVYQIFLLFLGVQSSVQRENPKVYKLLNQLQELVIEMKDAFTLAMGELSKIQYSDRLLEEKVEANNVENRKQVADVVQMVLSLKTDFSSVTTQIQAVNESQRTLQQQVETLQSEREVLLEEVAKVGSVHDSLRHKYPSQKTPLNNEAQLSVLLEKAHGGFQTHISDHDSGVANCRPGDISSCGEATPPTGQPLSPMMQSYINGLHNSQDLPDEYDSDGSITAAANKSIDLSRTLHDKCLDVDESISSEGEPNSAALSRTPNGATDQGALHIENPITAQVTSPLQSPLTRKLAPHEQMIQDGQRLRVARELVETEKKFCSNLWTIIDFLVEAVKSSGTVSARDMSVLFPPSLPSLYELHSSLLLKMEDRLASWKLQGILGDIFGRISDSNSDFFPLYQCYVNEFPSALEMIRKSAKHSQKFKKLVRDLQGHPACQGLDLGAYLLTPIQRPPRYVLLLKQMLKHTDRDHPDFYYLESTLNRLKMFLDQLNSSMETGIPMAQYSYQTKRKPPRARSASAANGISSSCDGLNFSMTTRDSGVHSPDESSYMNSTNANAKRFSLFKRSWERLSMSFYPPKSKVKPVQYDPHDVSSSSLQQSKKMFSSANQLDGAPQQSQDSMFSHGALTMPSRGDRKKKKKLKQLQERTENYETSEHSDHHRYSPQSTPAPMDRRESPSVKLGHWNDEQFSRRIDSDSDIPAKDSNSSHYERGHYRQPITSDTSMEYDMYMDSFKNGDLSVALANRRDPFVTHSTPRGHHHRSPRHDFGIYGDDDNDVCDHSTYQPSIQTKGTLTRRVPKLGISGRSKSQENICEERNHANPIPQPQNLSGQHFKSRPKSALSMPYIHPPSGQKLVERAWDDNNYRSSMSHDTSESSPWNDSVLNDSTSGNSTVLETSRRKESKKKRKERQRPNESLSRTSDSNKSKKRTTLKDSIKQIFTRKRGSRVIELSDSSQKDYCNESLNASHLFPGENDHGRRKSSLGNLSQQTLSNELPQRRLSNDASHTQRIRGNDLHQRRMSSPLAVHSYEIDENGDPCSAV
ncbi:uncharacterized protein LOC135484162 isoform X3 [Lineus longissimus]|uniref:uncharacterized protein LOC135484162 isoform X3 n=1 Tax=Lineus longissimus TaxID=88925 RepID=UPI00315D0F83